jgi:microcompartment protein CcmL/EutN
MSQAIGILELTSIAKGMELGNNAINAGVNRRA